MKNIPFIFILILLIPSTTNAAMFVNNEGHGQVLLYPYYTVNNNLNTIYSVVNTTADTKAIKVRFLEGENGAEVLDFNVYLDGYDMWQASLIPITSTITGHVGEDTALHIHSDESCTPYLSQSGQEFLPYLIDADDSSSGNTDLFRSTNGHIEIIEMSTFNGPTVGWADHDSNGIPNSCADILDSWKDFGGYVPADETNVTGGLIGSASIIDVAEGTAVSYEAIAIDQFWTNSVGTHSEPGSLLPNLGQGDLNSQTIVDNSIQNATWQQGFLSVSSLLMQYQIINEFAIEGLINGRSEWVINFPTKRYHVNDNPVYPPFSQQWNGISSCDPFSLTVWDRNQISQEYPVGPHFCYQTNVLEFLPSGQLPGIPSNILGSDNLITIPAINSPHASENGWALIEFSDPLQNMYPFFKGEGLLGLPAIGFQVQKFTNSEAQPGLIAQYSSLHMHKGKSQIAPEIKSGENL